MQHPFLAIVVQLPLPHHTICHDDNTSACEWRTRWLEDKVRSFEIHPATNDITGLIRYSSNMAIYTNVHVLVISYFILIFWLSNFFRIDKFFATSNFLHYFFDTQFFFYFRHFTQNILLNYLKFHPKCLKNSAIIFPKFLKYFHEVFVPNFPKFLTPFPKFVLIFL